jgi:hypothetical protein
MQQIDSTDDEHQLGYPLNAPICSALNSDPAAAPQSGADSGPALVTVARR